MKRPRYFPLCFYLWKCKMNIFGISQTNVSMALMPYSFDLGYIIIISFREKVLRLKLEGFVLGLVFTEQMCKTSALLLYSSEHQHILFLLIMSLWTCNKLRNGRYNYFVCFYEGFDFQISTKDIKQIKFEWNILLLLLLLLSLLLLLLLLLLSLLLLLLL